MKINMNDSRPKYLQLKDALKRLFEEAHYQSGQQTPSENELMEQFDVSRSTVRQALTDLANEGVIYRKQGVGSFFAGTVVEQTPRSSLIGVIAPILFEYIYPQIMQGANDIIHQKGCNIVLASSEGKPENEMWHIEQLLSKKIEGLLFEPAGSPQDFEETKTFQMLKSLSIPVVFMDWAFDDRSVSYVALDDVEGGFRATQHLIEAGHRRIGIVYLEHHVPSKRRYEGYRHALEQHGLTPDPAIEKHRTIVRWNESDSAYLLTKELLESGCELPTAIFYFNDAAALRGCAAIREAGLSIPDDISVMGFDDASFASLLDVPLTTMIHPKYQIGKWAAEMLFDQLDSQGRSMPHQMLLHPNIVVRHSVKILR